MRSGEFGCLHHLPRVYRQIERQAMVAQQRKIAAPQVIAQIIASGEGQQRHLMPVQHLSNAAKIGMVGMLFQHGLRHRTGQVHPSDDGVRKSLRGWRLRHPLQKPRLRDRIVRVETCTDVNSLAYADGRKIVKVFIDEITGVYLAEIAPKALSSTIIEDVIARIGGIPQMMMAIDYIYFRLRRLGMLSDRSGSCITRFRRLAALA